VLKSGRPLLDCHHFRGAGAQAPAEIIRITLVQSPAFGGRQNGVTGDVLIQDSSGWSGRSKEFKLTSSRHVGQVLGNGDIFR
jgi:hypothetical protein